VQAFIAEFDADGDGRVTWAEFEQFRRTRFDATDADHDGTLSEASTCKSLPAACMRNWKAKPLHR
jgi:Ca2+-binding EF-hand superfamily protein